MLDNETESESTEVRLTDAQKAKIERNRQKALLLRQARLSEQSIKLATDGSHKMKLNEKIDTGAGFFLEDEEEPHKKIKLKHEPGPTLLPEDMLICDSCGKEFMDSYLMSHFDCLICDKCRADDEADVYKLISKTDAKTQYLLKDSDFDKREPILKFVLRKNPLNPRWGDMKLFLEIQVKKRAMEVWENEEKIEEEKESRLDKREKTKEKRFEKKVKKLRNEVRSSLVRKGKESHVHEFDEETYDEEEDMYSKTCKDCGHVMTYEKM